MNAEDLLYPPHEDLVVLPARYGRTCLVPLGSARIRLRGSTLYPANRTAAQLYRAALRAWVTLGGARLTHRVQPARGGGWALAEELASVLPAVASAAVSVGGGPDRPITLQLMDKAGSTLAFAKYVETPAARTHLATEAHLLRRLPPGLGPGLIHFGAFGCGDLLVQQPVPGRPVAPRPYLDAGLRDFLHRLVRTAELYPPQAHPFITSLASRAPRYRAELQRVIDRLGSAVWPAAWTHGDFVALNVHRWRDRCGAFDWQWGREEGFPYLDAAFWACRVPHNLIYTERPEAARDHVLRVVRSVLPGERLDQASAVVALSALDQLADARDDDGSGRHGPWLEAFLEATIEPRAV